MTQRFFGGDWTMEEVGFWTAAVIASVLVGMGKGGIPSVGMLSVPILALVMTPVAAAGLLLPVYVLSDMFGLYAYRKDFDRKVLLYMVPGMLVGIGLAWATAHIVPEWGVTILIGAIGVAFALDLIFRRKGARQAKPARVLPGQFWGAVSGFTSFVSHSGGPPYQIYTLPLGMAKLAYAGTSTIFFAIVNAAKIVPYWQLGQLHMGNLKTAALLMPVAALSVFAGVKLLKVLPEKRFFQLVTWTLLLVSIKLVADGCTMWLDS